MYFAKKASHEQEQFGLRIVRSARDTDKLRRANLEESFSPEF